MSDPLEEFASGTPRAVSHAGPSPKAWPSPKRRRRFAFVFLLLGALALAVFLPFKAENAAAQTPGLSTITIDAHDLGSGSPLGTFNYIVSLDNTHLASAADPLDRPGVAPTESYSPLVATGDQSRASIDLPDGRYLISVRAPDHKLWGKHITLPQDAGVVRIDLSEASEVHPLPTGKIKFYVFNDNAFTNAAPDAEEVEPGSTMAGFRVTLEEQTDSQVSVDYHNRPLCSAASGSITGTPGHCTTQADGFIQINDLSPTTYFIYVTPPNGPCNSNPSSHWVQTTTFDGGFGQQAGVEEGSDGSGAPGEQLWEPPDRRTGYFAGFVCTPTPDLAGTGSISGRLLNWVGWPPFDTLVTDPDEPVPSPYVALTDQATDETIWVGRGDADGNFNIPNVPGGDYLLSIWDEQLNYIIRFYPVNALASGENRDLGDIGVSRWFGWLDGIVYQDLNNNDVYDQGVDMPLPNTDVDQRWRDGSIKEETFTDADGYYVYPTAEGGALGKWIVNEQGFARLSSFPGPSVHDEHDPSIVTPVGTDLGGGLLSNQLLSEGHRATVDWGKRAYGDEPGQIVGITYFATTRNEFDARFQAHENYEPAIPDAEVRLEGVGPDGLPNTSDDVVLNNYITDHWHQPGESRDGQTCNPIRDKDGIDITDELNPTIGPNCLEVPINGVQSKDGAFDGGYAFADYCPNGYDFDAPDLDNAPCWNAAHDDHQATDPLVAGMYIVHAVMPTDPADSRPCNPDNDGSGFKNASGPFGDEPDAQTGCLFKIVREEDVNVDLGNIFTPAIPPPPCVGDDHVVDLSTTTSRSTFYTRPGVNPADPSTWPHQPLCDKHLIELENKQNANADFFLMTNFPTQTQNFDEVTGDPIGGQPEHMGDVAEPGRIIGSVFNDIYFDRDPQSIWYGEPRPIGNIPVGIYGVDASGTHDPGSCPVTPGESNPCDWRLIETVTTDENGAYEALLPSTETFNCPIPQGPCPGMYIVVVDDPGLPGHANGNYNPNYLTAALAWDVWPGTTDQLDTPLDPISGTSCSLSRVDNTGTVISTQPELLQVRKVTDTAGNTNRALSEQGPFLRSSDTATGNRRIALDADFIGPAGATGLTGGHVVLTNQQTGAITNLTRASGGVLSWAPGTPSVADRVVIQVPALTPGTYQLDIVTSTTNAGGALSTNNGITLHVLGNGYDPPVVKVAPPTLGGHQLQNAIDGAAAGSLVVLGQGVYDESVVAWKPLKLQGLGPGGIIGAHELLEKNADDPRANVQGSVLDGRFFRDYQGNWDAVVGAHAPYAGVDATNPVVRGADITVLAQSQTAYSNGLSSARIDGIGLQTGQGEGAGGIQVQAYANNLRITNNILESNGGVFAGGIGLGQPYLRDGSGSVIVGQGSHNYNVQIKNNRLLGNGGLARSGSMGIFSGSNNYEVANNYVCGNFGVEYGAGISHWGSSPGGSIHDNAIFYNDAVDSGAGIAIADQTTGALQPLGPGSGAVDVDRNHIQGNFSGDDGGGIFVQNALSARINIRNNMIVDNGAADIGGAIALDDSANVAVVNNTIANNVSTGSSEQSLPIDQGGVPHSAGLGAEANDPRLGPGFSNPVALFNNIFWNNNAFLLDTAGPGAALVSQGFIDLEVSGTGSASDTLTPRYSLLTNGNILLGDGSLGTVPGGQGNTIGADPNFVTAFVLELAVSGSRGDPQQAAVTITGQDPAVGIPGDYHILATSPAVDNGAGFSNLVSPIPNSASTQTPGSGAVLAPCSTEAVTTLTSNPSPGATTITVASKAGFPTTFPFFIQIERNNGNGETEILRVDSNGTPAATVWNVTRGSSLGTAAPFGGTTSRNHSAGQQVRLMDPFYPADFDREFRPQLRVSARVRTPWDIGADELPGTVVPRWLTIPGHYSFAGPQGNVTFDWNGPGQLQCSGSTETR